MKITIIASNTFREIIRDRILYNILIFAVIIICSTVLLGKLSIGEHLKIVEDMGLSAIELFGVLISIFVGISLVHKEIDKKTIYTIISKPVSRHEFILGKLTGLILIVFTNIAIMSIVLLLMSWIISGEIHMGLLMASFMIFLEMIIITSIAILFSSFSTPFLSTLFSLSIFIIGTATTDIRNLGLKASPAAKLLTDLLYYILPNLDNFDIKLQVVYSKPIEPSYIWWVTVYSILYSAVITTLTLLIFEKRDFK